MNTLPAHLSSRALARILEHLRITETKGPDGGPAHTLRSPMSPSPVGEMRFFTGAPLERVVTVSLIVPPIHLDSHMIFAFTPRDSAVPHFTLDAVGTSAFFAFHLDLIPRADLGAELAYVNAVYQPLTVSFDAASSITGLSPAQIGPRQRALMSPWMLAHRADPAAFETVGKPVDEYLAHWLALLERGIAPEVLGTDPSARVARDRANRAALFSPEIDPVWLQVDRLVGPQTSARIRAALTGQEEGAR
jgi:hypothetical protein